MTAPNAFIGRDKPPTSRDLGAALGAARAIWDAVLARLDSEFGPFAREWSSYSIKAGWSMRLKRGERNILYFIPEAGGFSVSLVLGDKALAAARKAGLPAAVLAILKTAKKYPEGTGIRIAITGEDDAAPLLVLTAAKLGLS